MKRRSIGRGVGAAAVVAAVAALSLVAWGRTGTADAVSVGPLAEARANHTATLLHDGRVLVVGGVGADGDALASAEVYDPATGAFSGAGTLQSARLGHTATRLDDGSVLVIGGRGFGRLVERFDPATGAWDVAGMTLAARRNHSATRLPDGRVLIVGGSGFPDPPTELFDPISGESAPGPELQSSPRQWPLTTLLDDGQALVVNGFIGADARPVASAELLEFGRNASRLIDPPASGTMVGESVMLPDGRVWFSWGELFDPESGSWVAAETGEYRVAGTATLLNDGRILLAGGTSGGATPTATTAVVDPESGSVAPGPGLAEVRAHQTATRLLDGNVLIVGGSSLAAVEGTSGELAPLASAEVWQGGAPQGAAAALPLAGSGGLDGGSATRTVALAAAALAAAVVVGLGVAARLVRR